MSSFSGVAVRCSIAAALFVQSIFRQYGNADGRVALSIMGARRRGMTPFCLQLFSWSSRYGVG